jgi:hypothetical protein
VTRAAALVAAVALAAGSCEWAQRHPAVTAGIAGGTIGFFGCEVDSVKVTTCAAIGGAAGLFLGGIAGLAMLFLNTNEDDQQAPPPNVQEMTRSGAIRVHTHTAPPPVVIDAGVDAGPDAVLGAVALDAPAAADAPIDQ